MKLSIIIPVYNVENYISRCLDSVINQSFQNFEIIIVDDRGTDNSMSIVHSYASIDKRFKILHHDHNRGLMVARKTGYTAAIGDYYMFLDSDDWLTPDALQIMAHEIISEPDIDIVCGRYQIVKSNKEIIQDSSDLTGIFSSYQVMELLINKKTNHSLCAKIYKKSLFDNSEHLPCFENQILSEDLLLFYNLINRAKKIKFIKSVIYNYYYNNQSSTKTIFNRAKFCNLVRAYNYTYDFLSYNYPGLIDDNYHNAVIELISINLLRGIPSDLLSQFPQYWLNLYSWRNIRSRNSLIKSVILITMYNSVNIRKFINQIYK